MQVAVSLNTYDCPVTGKSTNRFYISARNGMRVIAFSQEAANEMTDAQCEAQTIAHKEKTKS